MSEKNEINVKIDVDRIKQEMKNLASAESRIAELESENKEFRDNAKAEGTIPMTTDMRKQEMNGSNNQKEFDSVESMIEWARVNDKESYEALKKKSFEAIPKNNFSWEDQFIKGEDGVERSLILRTIQRLNQDHRKRFRG